MKEINEKHLEFVQNVISRHNSNSFKIKGWAITLTSAIFALTGTIKEPYLCFIALGPILMFWILDSMFLANERCFVNLYSCISNGGELEVKNEKLKKQIAKENEKKESKKYMISNFSMNFLQFREIKRNNWWVVIFSYTIVWFYLALIALTLVTFLGLNEMKSNNTNQTINVNANIATADSLLIAPIKTSTDIEILDTINIQDIKIIPQNNQSPEELK